MSNKSFLKRMGSKVAIQARRLVHAVRSSKKSLNSSDGELQASTSQPQHAALLAMDNCGFKRPSCTDSSQRILRSASEAGPEVAVFDSTRIIDDDFLAKEEQQLWNLRSEYHYVLLRRDDLGARKLRCKYRSWGNMVVADIWNEVLANIGNEFAVYEEP